MDNKQKYIDLCEKKDSIPIYSRWWWLDAVAGKDNWDVILSDKGGTISAVMPICYKKKKGLIIKQPLLTQTSGIWIDYPKNQKVTSKISFERKVSENIINQLESLNLNYYCQNFHYNFTNWLPFYWKGFNQTTRYTYIIEDTSNEEQLYSNIDSTTKNLIRKAEKSVEIKRRLDIDKFYEVNRMTFDRKGMKIPYSLEIVKRIDNACAERNQREILYAEDEEGNIHAAIYLVWDKMSMYYIMGGINPDFKKTNATSLLLWEAIKLAGKMKLKFDFEGSMNKDIEKFFSTFGAIQKPFYTISKRYVLDIKSTVYLVINNWNNVKRKLKNINNKKQ